VKKPVSSQEFSDPEEISQQQGNSILNSTEKTSSAENSMGYPFTSMCVHLNI
jgi:hypothetical protein